MLYHEEEDRASGGNMNRYLNPYPETITDESSGMQVPNIAHRIWQEGYEAGHARTIPEEDSPENNR